MALYDSSQLANIVMWANMQASQVSGNLYNLGVTATMNSFIPLNGSQNPFISVSGTSNPFITNNFNLILSQSSSVNPFIGYSKAGNVNSGRFNSSTSLYSTALSGSGSSNWSRYGYDANAGARLASVARNNSVGFTGYCAKYVKTAISEAGLGSYECGHAYAMDDILRRNPRFREIPASTNVKSLPAGCVLVFNQGSKGYSSRYGHTEITDGKGHGISDGITRNLKQPDAIFMPVAA